MSVALDWVDIGRFSQPTIETGAGLEGHPAAEALPAIIPLVESLIGGEWRRLRQPVRLRVRLDEGLYFVENETLSLFGHGQNLATAVAEFRRDLEYFWNYYRLLDADQVAGEGARLKDLYETLFE